MDKKIKSTLSPLQRSRLIKISILLSVCAVTWLLFAPDMGIISMQKERARLEELHQQKARLEKENAALREEIERIESDIEYFERIAREKHGLIRKNEILFDFDKGDDKK